MNIVDVDTSLFQNDTMKGLKRTVRRFGKPLGHRKGVNGTELLGYIEARKQIYIPTYRWVLENKVADIIERLREASKKERLSYSWIMTQMLMWRMRRNLCLMHRLSRHTWKVFIHMEK